MYHEEMYIIRLKLCRVMHTRNVGVGFLASSILRSSVPNLCNQDSRLRYPLLPVASISYYSGNSPKTSNDKSDSVFALNEGTGR